MCGIFGIFLKSKDTLTVKKIKAITSDLMKFSESRGKEATGLASQYDGGIQIIKSSQSAKYFIQTKKYKDFFQAFDKPMSKQSQDPCIIIGHSRLVTNGSQKNDKNNQPVSTEDLVCVHNGIIVNDQALWSHIPHLEKESEVDTEVFLKLIGERLKTSKSIVDAVQIGHDLMEGAASIALFQKTSPNVILATNTGSLYSLESLSLGVIIFASEEQFLKKLLNKGHFSRTQKKSFVLKHLKPGTGLHLSVDVFKQETFSFSLSSFGEALEPTSISPIYSCEHLPPLLTAPVFNDSLKRCTHCILPETMPFISFNPEGVCNYCLSYRSYKTKPLDELENILKGYRKNDGRPDCIVAFSGGRDSSYGMHLIKKELNLTPLAMTYDWGVVTDLARRNQARICGSLGIEHILVSANIEQKRLNIKKNLEAWLNRPELGMIPLLMAGDKKFFYYANKVASANNINLIIFCVNPLEKTDFKSGFCGINQSGNVMFNQISFWQNIKLLNYYIKNFLMEPKYLNGSLFDTASAYFISYFMKHPYVQLFDYYRWDEEKINDTLINEYNWETDPTTTTTWRIGDGTAAFYNYIYHHMIGFTENDTFRSNQIREGVITREQAIRLVQEENKPRHKAIENYLSLVGVDFEKTMSILDSLPKFY